MKYKYYFKKPKTEIAKDILVGLALAGAVVMVAAISPSSVALSILQALKKNKKYDKKKSYDVFYRLKREGYITVGKHNHQMYISLTPEGKKKAGRFQINSLHVKKPKRWDGDWRVVVFDIKHKQRIKREALRGFLKRMGFYQLQKSVWLHPYDCRPEVELLKEFFGFTTKELTFLLAHQIEDDGRLRKVFHL